MRKIRREEFSILVNKYSRLIYSVCYNITRDPYESEDLMQETFLSAYRHIEQVEENNLRGWLITIAANKCRDYMRKSITHPSEPLNEDSPDEYSPTPDERAASREQYEGLCGIIASLKPKYREVANAYYIEQISLARFAEREKLPLSTAQTRLRRAREMIKKNYREEFGNE